MQAIEALVARLSDAPAPEEPEADEAHHGPLRLLRAEDLAAEEPPVTGAGEQP